MHAILKRKCTVGKQKFDYNSRDSYKKSKIICTLVWQKVYNVIAYLGLTNTAPLSSREFVTDF